MGGLPRRCAAACTGSPGRGIALRALRVFHDHANLGANPGLWSEIQRALDASEFFVLLASPEAAASKWVNREVEHWRHTGKPVDNC